MTPIIAVARSACLLTCTHCLIYVLVGINNILYCPSLLCIVYGAVVCPLHLYVIGMEVLVFNLVGKFLSLRDFCVNELLFCIFLVCIDYCVCLFSLWLNCVATTQSVAPTSHHWAVLIFSFGHSIFYCAILIQGIHVTVTEHKYFNDIKELTWNMNSGVPHL